MVERGIKKKPHDKRRERHDSDRRQKAEEEPQINAERHRSEKRLFKDLTRRGRARTVLLASKLSSI
jgi:hypothetical protein